MSDKKEKPPRDKDVLDHLHGFAKDAFNTAGTNAKLLANDARNAINFGRKVTDETYQFVEKTVGKERIISAAVVGKAAGVVGLVGGPVVAFKAGIVGGVVGFIGGKRLAAWLDDGKANDSEPPAANVPAPDKPKDPGL